MARGKKTGGGSRKGKPNKSTQDVKTLLDTKVNFGKVVEKLYELSQGISVLKQMGEASVVYKEKPDPYAARILLEYRFGKPLQEIKQETETDMTIKIVRE